MILVTFAVPFESAAFRKTPASRSVRIVHTGVGADRARVAAELALCAEAEPPSQVIVSGFAGALDPDLEIGAIVRDHTHRFSQAPEVLATAAAKAAWRAETRADVVDMETAAILEVCAAAGVPAMALRVISDRADDDLGVPPDLLEDLARQPLLAGPRLLAMLARDKARRRAFLRLVKDCKQAQRALADALTRELAAEPSDDRVPR